LNYLAHLLLAEPTPAGRVGNLLGDFVKGGALHALPSALQRGVLLHREIDVFTDSHPVVRRSRRRLGDGYHLVRPLMIDLFYDHFLARSWERFSDLPLAVFAAEVYAALARYEPHLPERLRRALPRMRDQDWLSMYRELGGVERALQGMARRLRRPTRIGEGLAALQASYDPLRADFLEFFPALRAHVEQAATRRARSR